MTSSWCTVFPSQQYVAMSKSEECVFAFPVPSGVIMVRPISHWKAPSKYVYQRLHVCIVNPSISVQIWSPSLKMYGVNSFKIYTETKMLSFCWNFHHWLHWKLSFWQLPVQSVMEISSKWKHICLGVWVWIMILTSLFEVSNSSNMPALLQTTACCQIGDKLSWVVCQIRMCDQRSRSMVAFIFEPMLFFTLLSFMWLIWH